MDCLEALEWMDAGDAADPGDASLVQAAREHAAQCPHCREVWPAHAAWSQLLESAMPAVPIPLGLRERLLAECTAPVPQLAPHAVPAAQQRQSRRLVWSVSAAALFVLLALAVRSVWLPPTPVSLPQMFAGVVIDFAVLPEFHGRFEPRLPASWSSAFVLERSFVRGYPEAGPTSGQMAIVPFQYTLRSGTEPLKGRLMMVPRQQFVLAAGDSQQPALPNDFLSAEVRYLPGGRGAFLVWGEDDLVYVCLMASGPADLARFQRSLIGGRSLT